MRETKREKEREGGGCCVSQERVTLKVATSLVRQLGQHRALIWRALVRDMKVRERGVRGRGGREGPTMLADCEATLH